VRSHGRLPERRLPYNVHHCETFLAVRGVTGSPHSLLFSDLFRPAERFHVPKFHAERTTNRERLSVW
jgi:hypothetical protein